MSPRTRACSLYRAAVLDFVDSRRREPGTDDALDHLDRCARCRADAEATALAVAALRRLADDSAGHGPSTDAWPRLRRRLEQRSTARAQLRAVVGGGVASAALVGVLVGAATWRPASFASASTDALPVPAVADGASLSDATESRLLDHSGRPIPRPEAATPRWMSISLMRWPGPDGLGTPARARSEGAPARGK